MVSAALVQPSALPPYSLASTGEPPWRSGAAVTGFILQPTHLRAEGPVALRVDEVAAGLEPSEAERAFDVYAVDPSTALAAPVGTAVADGEGSIVGADDLALEGLTALILVGR